VVPAGPRCSSPSACAPLRAPRCLLVRALAGGLGVLILSPFWSRRTGRFSGKADDPRARPARHPTTELFERR
jgi:hypothetical protein